MSATNHDPVSPSGEAKERVLICLFSLLAAVHVFVFSAAFPIFNNMDEIPHFDLVVKYSHGHLPRGLEPMCEESSLYTMTYNSPEFVSPPGHFPDGRYPTPFWAQSTNGQLAKSQRDTAFQQAEASWNVARKLPFWTNYESSQQPLYYAVAGMWWRIGQWFDIEGLRLVYWVRFLNILFVAALVWTGYAAARLVFPENLFLRLGVPAIIAFIPQTAFYSIQNDVLSPLCFGVAFILVLKFLRAESPDARLGIFTGLACSATFLTKMSNAPMLCVLALAALPKIWHLHRTGKYRATLAGLAFCSGLPVVGWLMWTKLEFGDFIGTAAKIRFITWTYKPFGEWWHHPIFTPQGFWTFISDALVAFWQGEFRWHGLDLNLPVVNAFYVIPTVCFVALAAASLLPRFSVATQPQRQPLWISFACFMTGIAFLAFLSIIFDFGICINPSRGHPYFTSGRLIIGALIPFLIFILYGIEFLLRSGKKKWVRRLVLAGIILFMLISEIITDWPVFSSQYNWFHA